jgi:two-component system, NtrC family, response regulator GlrR
MSDIPCSSAPHQSSVPDLPFGRLNLIGESAAFQSMLRLVLRLASSKATVLLQGETGTGKELVAGSLHYLSDRRDGPFISINCGSIPDSLFEAEVFGHARGAFTDAREARQGLIAQARGGTLFLDEVEALSPRGQVALLRFLQNQEYRPVGGSIVRQADVRVVGATNADLTTLVERGLYRQDLLFRLTVLVVDLPPLRERGDDVIVLARAFLERLCRQYGRALRTLHRDSIAPLRAYDWPGNVRELENLVHRAFLVSDDAELRLAPAPVPAPEAPVSVAQQQSLTATGFREAKARAIAEFERAYLVELLKRAGGNVSLAARLAGKERSRLGRLIRKHGLSQSSFRSAVAKAG